MLKRENRLKNERDFRRAYTSRKRYDCREFSIQWAPRENITLSSRFGVVVSNKISKRAVKKNRAKRLLREAIRNLIKEKFVPTGSDFVIAGKKPILDADYQLLSGILKKFFQKKAIG